MPAELLKVAEADNKIDVITMPSIIARYLIFNTRYAPLADAKVGQAIDYAIDKQAIINIAMGGAATQLDSILPPNMQSTKNKAHGPSMPGKGQGSHERSRL